MVDLVAGDVLDEVDGFPLIDPQAHQVHQDGVVDGAAVLHVGGATLVFLLLACLLLLDALTLLLCGAGNSPPSRYSRLKLMILAKRKLNIDIKTTSRMLVTDKRLCVWCPNRRSVFSAKPYRKIICRRVTATFFL
ncbi:hypothetical protein [Aeromonas caviae]|uniref:hypothetical protein n=1 Tax=Aeromonas caviae TaxID=648 RepID=UPI001CC534D5|nr:hypothetical protein [Aeromonas caviae]